MTKKQIVCISGWGQKFDSLEFIFRDGFDSFTASSLDYSQFNSVENFFSFVKSQNLSPEILVGWSLGGQLCLRLIAAKILQPKFLVLIAPPFQLVKDARVQAGMSVESFAEFRNNFANAPSATLKKFSILMSMNDKNSAEIARGLDVSDKNFDNLVFWLDELKRFSCFDLDFSSISMPVFYFHGAGDMIVHVSQAQYFKQRIANCQDFIFTGCGHAPHLHNVARMREILKSTR